MVHIRQIGTENTNSYTIVNTDGWTKPLAEHPSVVEHPELFEIVDTDIPDYVQYLNYTG